jgi:DNA repair protein RadD
VFACTVEHSRLLAAALTLEGCSAGHLDSSLSRSARQEVVRRLHAGSLSVLVNYGVLSTGFDAPEISAVVITRPTTSVVLYSQMVGRGLRGPESGGAAKCVLIDVKDNFHSFGAVDDVYAAFAGYWQ